MTMQRMARGFANLSREHLRGAAKEGVVTAQALVALGDTGVDRLPPVPGRRPLAAPRARHHPDDHRASDDGAARHCSPAARGPGRRPHRPRGMSATRDPPRPAPQPPVHVLVPHERQVRSAAHIQVERSRRLPAAVVRGGVPLAPVPRAVIDAARRLRDAREITELIADPDAARAVCTVAQPRTPGSTRWLWHGRSTRWRGTSTPIDYEREQERTARFVAAGVPVLPTSRRGCALDARAVLDELARAYGHAASRPRPAVRATRPS